MTWSIALTIVLLWCFGTWMFGSLLFLALASLHSRLLFDVQELALNLLTTLTFLEKADIGKHSELQNTMGDRCLSVHRLICWMLRHHPYIHLNVLHLSKSQSITNCAMSGAVCMSWLNLNQVHNVLKAMKPVSRLIASFCTGIWK